MSSIIAGFKAMPVVSVAIYTAVAGFFAWYTTVQPAYGGTLLGIVIGHAVATAWNGRKSNAAGTGRS
jgi:hypothetical protein